MLDHLRKPGFLVRLSCALLPLAFATGVEAATPKEGEVTILRDNYGTPRVYGSTDASLWYGVGYAMAQDRLWQAELLRRTARGTTAELFGPPALGGDITLRTLTGPEEGRIAQFEAATEEQKLIFTAYTDGINAYIAEAIRTGTLPQEFSAFGFEPEEWSPTDSINILQMLWLDVATGGGEELANAAQLQQLIAINGPEEGAKIFADTHWLEDPDAPTIVPANGALNPAHPGAGIGHGKPVLPAADFTKIQSRLDDLRSNLRRVGMGSGSSSNAAVIGPKLSATGRPLLMGGPQVGYSSPQLGHEMGIHYSGYDTFGVGVAGLPLTVVGVSTDMSWTTVTGGTDNSDIYAEVVNPDNPQQYRFNGEWLDYDCRLETFGVAGAPDTGKTICESVHGPVLGTAPGLAFSLKIAGRGKDLQSHEAYLGMIRAGSVQEAQESLKNFPYNLSLVSADRRGNIAYWHLGEIPLRAPDDNPWLPHDGTGNAEWQGFVPWEDMPRTVNPEQGWISAWNNKPRAGWQNSRMDFWNWGPVHRASTLTDYLSQLEPGTATIETLEELNRFAGWTNQTPSNAARNIFAPPLLGELLSRVDTGADPRLPAIAELLGNWDMQQLDLEPMGGDGYYDSPAVAIFNTWWPALTTRVFGDELGPQVMPALGSTLGNLVYRLLVDGVALPLQHDYLDGESAEQAVTAALVDALNQLTTEYASSDPGGWLQPVATIDWKPIGLGAVPDTVWMNRGTYNYIIQHGPGNNFIGQSVMAPGQSGDSQSPHFEDQLELYQSWEYKPMRLTRSGLNGAIESVIRLTPAWPN
ncbi:penicillin amidase [Marinobacterium nitratireducens]|uniref:Penicillin amidase n=1 Tax=Marinobacterium nitratireducens TaxID=518897 RepID=A0A918DWR0_9GAMM|nr:penicillin acylase family protein [Marinobacterium nitratireducens]GGO87184.1 penicillin amidase [Marinobacterium nitratireducens]